MWWPAKEAVGLKITMAAPPEVSIAATASPLSEEEATNEPKGSLTSFSINFNKILIHQSGVYLLMPTRRNCTERTTISKIVILITIQQPSSVFTYKHIQAKKTGNNLHVWWQVLWHWLDPSDPRFEQAMQKRWELIVMQTDMDCTVIHHPTSLICCTHTKLHSVIWALFSDKVKGIMSLLNQRNPACSWNHIWKKMNIKQQKEKLGTLTATSKFFNSRLSSLGVIRYWLILWKHQSSSVQRNKQVHLFNVYSFKAVPFVGLL